MGEADNKKGQRTVARQGPLVQGVSQPLVTSSVKQLTIFVLDASGSMDRGKLDEAIAATDGCVKELADPKNRGAFEAAIVAYGEHARILLEPKPVAQVRPEDFAVKVGAFGGWTNITSGLVEARKLADRSRPGNWARPVVVLMTDGEHNHGTEEPEGVATTLKAKADLVCVAFGGAQAKLDRLQGLATTPTSAVRCTNGSDLRQFFAKVGRTMSVAIRTGQNTATLLGEGGVIRG